MPVKFPLRSVVTFVNGRVFTPTPEVFPGTVPAGGLKLMVGKGMSNTGVSFGVALKMPELSAVKKRPQIVVVETCWTGVTQLTCAGLEFRITTPSVVEAWTASMPLLV